MIVGVAGHIDHGKTALVRALTGVDTDRLPQEQARGMTIDLGYAYLPAPDGQVVGFVDMPGHEKFMRNMLAGATGIDLLLLVVAADDGVMPQTREHLAVAQLLGLDRALVAIGKTDAVAAERVAAVEQQVRALLDATPFAMAPILPTSARTGDGIDLVRQALFTAAAVPVAPAPGPLRLAIDRSFSLPGAGTVVTGVVMQGQVAIGDSLLLSPSGQEVRVRSLHVQNRAADVGHAGQRCGVALGGRLGSDEVGRGDMLIAPELHQPVERFDAVLHLLSGEKDALRHWSAVRLHHGASEQAVRVAVLQDGPLQPGGQCFVQVVGDQPLALAVNDRFVIRAANGSCTLGGGRVVDPHPPHRRRKQPLRLARLEAMALADPAASLAAQAERWPWFVDVTRFARDRALDAATRDSVLASVPHELAGTASQQFLFAPAVWQNITRSALGEVSLFHQRFPRLLGPNLSRLTLAMGPRLPQVVAAAALDRLAREGLLVRESGVFRQAGHSLGLDREDIALWGKIAPLLGGEARFRPPLEAELAHALAVREIDCRRVLKLKAREGKVAQIAPGRYLTHDALTEVATIIGELAAAAPDGLFGAADLRDRLANGRKVAIELLEYFDLLRITARRGDLRLVELDRLASYLAGGDG